MGNDTKTVIDIINSLSAGGSTNIYDTSRKALEILKEDDDKEYTKTIILMTDGKSNVGSYSDFKKYYEKNKSNVPIYSITFGDSDSYELSTISNLTNGKVFDGKSGLKEAFMEVRSYN